MLQIATTKWICIDYCKYKRSNKFMILKFLFLKLHPQSDVFSVFSVTLWLVWFFDLWLRPARAVLQIATTEFGLHRLL